MFGNGQRPARRWLIACLLMLASAPLHAGGPTQTEVDFAADFRADAPPLLGSVSQYGITWTFDRPVRVGKFITGDYYVVGPVTVTDITPKPSYGDAGRNGSMLNPVPADHHGYDSRTIRYDRELGVQPPIRMKPGDSLISTVSHEQKGHMHVYPHTRESTSPLRTAAVLSCLSEAVPPDTFRPSYCGEQTKLRRYSDLHLGLLPSVEPAQGMPGFELYERVFQRPWIDHVYGFGTREAHPTENMPDYRREIGRAVGEGTLMLLTDAPLARKKGLLIGIVQYAIDLEGVIGAYQPAGGMMWFGPGCHGRKWTMVFAGILLQDEAMQRPEAIFGEDTQSVFDRCWTGANVVFGGLGGVHPRTGEVVVPDPGRLPYEDLHPSEWNSLQGEGYRRCCTAVAWIGQALAARIMHAEKVWDHDAFFVYCDRWMTEDDSQHVDAIKDATGRDYSQNWGRQGQCWEKWVCDMWSRYRNDLPPAPDGQVDPRAEETWKEPQPVAWPNAPWRRQKSRP